MLCAPPISPIFTSSSHWYLLKSTYYEAPHYKILCLPVISSIFTPNILLNTLFPIVLVTKLQILSSASQSICLLSSCNTNITTYKFDAIHSNLISPK
jgi:hypothetical protein